MPKMICICILLIYFSIFVYFKVISKKRGGSLLLPLTLLDNCHVPVPGTCLFV